MILISHRGNVNGIKANRENTISYIQEALDLGYDVEIDIWNVNNILYLGHDRGLNVIDHSFINKYKDKLWLHCKDLKTLEMFYRFDMIDKKLNYFFHNSDKLVITSKGYAWMHYSVIPIFGSIAVLPEIYENNILNCIGICSDVIKKYDI